MKSLIIALFAIVLLGAVATPDGVVGLGPDAARSVYMNGGGGTPSSWVAASNKRFMITDVVGFSTSSVLQGSLVILVNGVFALNVQHEAPTTAAAGVFRYPAVHFSTGIVVPMGATITISNNRACHISGYVF